MKTKIINIFLTIFSISCAAEVIRLEDCSKVHVREVMTQKIKAACVETNRLNGTVGCLAQLKTRELFNEKAYIETMAAEMITSSTLFAQRIAAQTIIHTTPYRAYLSLSKPTQYVLGRPIVWDVVVDDPHADVVLSPAPMHYGAPEDGYYVVTAGTGLRAFTGPFPLTGVPVLKLAVIVNGEAALKSLAPYLSASEVQNNVVTGIVALKKGDAVTASLQAFYLDPRAGVLPYPGIVTLEAIGETGQLYTDSFLIIHYLSSITAAMVNNSSASAPSLDCVTPC